eukprot:symbB.v1.2.038694.t1/scaffold6128.1/size22152/1
MAPVASRFAATGIALGLASTFVVPNSGNSKATTRALQGSTVASAPTSTSNHVATLAAASVCLAVGGVSRTRTQTQASFQPSQQIGASEPLGFFDPLGFTAVDDEEGFRKLRASEIKHGRLAMMASIGLVAQHYWKLPGFENLPSGFSILGKEEGVIGLFALFLVSGCLENVWREDPSGTKEPGNFGDPFGLQMYNEEMRTKELNNGRMAMISVLGIFAAEMASGQDAIQQFGL